MERPLKSIRDSGLSEHHRIAAAQTVLAQRTRQVTTLLKLELVPGGNVEIQYAIVMALTEAPLEILVTFKQPLLALLEASSERLIKPVAEALGRFEDRSTINSLIDIAQDPSKSESARAGAITALGYHPRRDVVIALIELIADDQPVAIRRASIAGLRRLTGRHDVGDNQHDWQMWWRAHRSKRTVQWQAMLLRNFVIQAHRSAIKQRRLEKYLAQSLRQYYLVQGQAQRPALLVKWLQDEVQVVRLLAMELTEQRLIDADALPIGDELRRVLRSLLDDPFAVMRRRAAKALSDLRDEQAASIAARRLDAGHERDVKVLRALLKLIRKMPRPEAIAPSMRLLSEPHLRSEAADVLAAAVGVSHDGAPWLTPQQTMQLVAEVRRHLEQVQIPNPSMIRLMGQIASGSDWQHIVGFLDSNIDAVKDAAARAWAESDQALTELEARGHDPVIQPFLYDAIMQRGSCAQTLIHLVANEPQTPSLRQARQQAILAMATRVSPEMVVRADEVLSKNEQNGELREKMLAAAIGQLQSGPNTKVDDTNSVAPDIHHAGESRALVDLLLSRSELWLTNGQAKLSLSSYERVRSHHSASLTLKQRHRLRIGTIQSHLALDNVETSLVLALSMVSRLSPLDDIVLQVLNIMLDAAERRIKTDQIAQARRIMMQLADAVPQEVLPAVRQRISDLQIKLEHEDTEPGILKQPTTTGVKPKANDESTLLGTEHNLEPSTE